MITRTVAAVQMESWQEQLARAITDPRELLSTLKLPLSHLPEHKAASQLFKLRVPHVYLQRIEPGNPDDPLLRQILPLGAELMPTPGFSSDPLDEAAHTPAPGVIHKYRGRLLLITASSCAINCRFCFRRHFPYSDNRISRSQLQQALTYIEQDKSITEVILSGGDPLTNSDQRLEELLHALGQIPHIERLRIHSRLPIVLPDRITDQLIGVLSKSRLQTVLVTHCNHPNELDHVVFTALNRLRLAGVTLLNQSVLLRGVNDDVHTLIKLSERLFHGGVLPYYLHLLDHVAGAAHFEVSFARASELLNEMALNCSGYLVPKLARENPNANAKLTYSPQTAALMKN